MYSWSNDGRILIAMPMKTSRIMSLKTVTTSIHLQAKYLNLFLRSAVPYERNGLPFVTGIVFPLFVAKCNTADEVTILLILNKMKKRNNEQRKLCAHRRI